MYQILGSSTDAEDGIQKVRLSPRHLDDRQPRRLVITDTQLVKHD